MSSDDSELWRRKLEIETQPASTPARRAEVEVPGLTILWHPDASRVGERLALTRLASGETVELSRLEPAFSAPGEALRHRSLDPSLSAVQ